MREFPNHLMSKSNQYYQRPKQDLPHFSVFSSLKKTREAELEQKRQYRQEEELADLEQSIRTPFTPKVLPPSQQRVRTEAIDYQYIKQRLSYDKDDFLLFDENQCCLHEELKTMSTLVEETSKHVKVTKRGLNQSMNGIFEKEIAPNRYFNKSK